MGKTLHEKISNTNTAVVTETEKNGELLIGLMQEMKGAWQEAANDLLQPRPEAVAQLLKKVLY
jgi:hypothetical protein